MVVPPAAIERAFGVTNIKSHIPLTLDFDDHNYDAWRELFLTHCLAFDVLGHIDGTLLPNGDNDGLWKKCDGLVKLWLYGTLTQSLFRSSFQTGGTARDIWLRIENQFRNNKEARAIHLDNELRTSDIGDQSVKEYCQKLKSMSDLLQNVDAHVPDRTLVMYLLNGLNEKYDYIINVIKHKEPFPTFEVAKSMLELEETRLKKSRKPSVTHTDHSSSSTALTVSDPVPRNQPQKFNNFRGNRRNNNNRGRGRTNFHQRPFNPFWAQQSYWPSPFPYWPNNNNMSPSPYPLMNSYRGPPPARPINQSAQQAYLTEIQPTTDFSHAFNTETLQEPIGSD